MILCGQLSGFVVVLLSLRCPSNALCYIKYLPVSSAITSFITATILSDYLIRIYYFLHNDCLTTTAALIAIAC